MAVIKSDIPDIRIIELNDEEWNEAIKDWRLWYKQFIRAYTWNNIIYIKKTAKFLFAHSKEDVILHEIGHILGYQHRWFGTMTWHGLWRL